MIKHATKILFLGFFFTITGLFFQSCTESAINPTDNANQFESIHSRSFDGSDQNANNLNQSDLNKQLAALRRATAPYHNMDKAKDAEYATQLTPCWYHGNSGAMGYHFGNPVWIDGKVDLLVPEALMYEPGKNGQYRLVGMEYIVPIDAWEEDDPPSLLGEEFMKNDLLGLYTLHVWLWKNNPNGMFSAWNPNVSCEYADESEDLS
jgi:hypothetical protein